MNWCKEKQIIVEESIDFETLVVAKAKLQVKIFNAKASKSNKALFS